MWELDHKEGWVPKNWCFQTVVLEKILESPLDCKEIKTVHPKGNQSWIFIGRTDAEALILRPLDAKNWLIRKDPDAGKDWRQDEKGTTEDRMVGWHHRLSGHEFEQTLGDREGQGSLVRWSPWVAKSRTRLRDWTTESKLLYLTGYTLLAIPSKYWGTIFYYQTDLSMVKLFFKGVFLHKSLRMCAMQNILFFFFFLPWEKGKKKKK